MNVPSSIPRLKLVSYSLSHLFSLLAPVNKESYPKYRGVNSLYVSVSQLRKNNLNTWQPNVNFAVSRQTVNRRLVARAYKARRMVKVPRLTVRAKLVRRHWAQKHTNRSLGQWQNVIFCDESIFMLFRIDNRIRVRRLVGEVMHDNCTHGNVAHGGGSVHVWGGISYMEKTLLVRSGSDVTGSRLSASYGGTLGST